MYKLAVVGSINTDYFIESEVFPKIGETILGKDFFLSVGGKGANQAVAASRLGGCVSIFASIGDDYNGKIIKRKLEDENINLSNLQTVERIPSGVAFIEICKGDNRILVVPGANDYTNMAYVENAFNELLQHDVFVFQLETPKEMLDYIVPKLYEHGKTIILNPAPAQQLNEDLIEKVTYLIPNEHEFQINFNSKVIKEQLLKQYPNKLIITCGSEGVQFYDGKKVIKIGSMNVKSIDTTGAGDTFVGAFAVAISEGKSLVESIKFGNIAAGLSITKKGAQTGMPLRKDVERYIKREGICNEEEGQAQTN